MSSLTSSVGKFIHGTATSLIKNQVTSKISTTITTVVESGFSVVDDMLAVVRDLSAPDNETKPPESRGGSS
jgi:hypothetical protein